MLRLFILLILMVALPDCYLWRAYVWAWPLTAQLCFLLTTLTAVAGMTMMPINRFPHNFSVRLLFGSMLTLVLPKMVFILADAVLSWPWALAVSGAVLLCVAYGFAEGWLRLTVRHETFSFADLPAAFDGYRIVHFTDLHAGTFWRKPLFIKRLTDTLLAQQADAAVFTGDLINLHADELRPFQQELSRLHATDGVFAVLGNHDFTKTDPDGSKLTLMEQQMGWQVLNDAHVIIRRGQDRLAVAGVRNIDDGVFKSHGNLTEALGGIPHGVFTILLTHTPTHWRREVLPTTRVPLTLAGHTHGGQMRLWRLSPARWLYREWAGRYRSSDGRWLYVSQGLGGTLPFRFLAWPEITVITLRRMAAE